MTIEEQLAALKAENEALKAEVKWLRVIAHKNVAKLAVKE